MNDLQFTKTEILHLLDVLKSQYVPSEILDSTDRILVTIQKKSIKSVIKKLIKAL